MSWAAKLRRKLRANERTDPEGVGGAGGPAPVETSASIAPSATPGGNGRSDIHGTLLKTILDEADGRLAPSDIEDDAHLFDYGYVDSLSAVNLLAAIEAHYGVEVDEVELVGRLCTLGALTDYVHAEVGS